MTALPYYHRNTGKLWTKNEVKQLEKLAKQDTPTPVIGVKLGRTVAAVYTRASQEGISLEPPNPHHKRK
jgi:predicted lipoprotein